MHMLGAIATSRGRPERAIQLIGKVVEMFPNFAEAQLNLGNAFVAAGKQAQGIACYRRAIALRPGYALANSALGREQSKDRDSTRRDAARRGSWPSGQNTREHTVCLRSVSFVPAIPNHPLRVSPVELDLQFAEGWASFGWALPALGRFDEAIQCFRRALVINPDLTEAQRSLIATGQYTADPAEIEGLRAAFAATDLDADARVAAGFALGTLLDRADDFDTAFACFAAANSLAKEALIAAGRAYDTAAFEQRIDCLIEYFTPEFFAAVAAGGVASELPMFIVGMSRSGTTLVEQIAASHPQVFGAGELNAIGRLAQSLPVLDTSPAVVANWLAAAPQLAEEHLVLLTKLGGDATRVIDNCGTICSISGRSPRCFRQPVSFCAGVIRATFAYRAISSCSPAATPIPMISRMHARCLRIDRLAAHWRRVLRVRMIEVSYEALVANIESEARRLIDFLGVDWEPACLEFRRTHRTVITQSTW